MLYIYVPDDKKVYVLEDYLGEGSPESIMATRAGSFISGVAVRLQRRPEEVYQRFIDEGRLRAHLAGLQEDPEFVTI